MSNATPADGGDRGNKVLGKVAINDVKILGKPKTPKTGNRSPTSFGGVLAWSLIGVDDPKAPKPESQSLPRQKARQKAHRVVGT